MIQIVGERGGTNDEWEAGAVAFFEYHCWRDHKSSDAELWYRDHQEVIVLRENDDGIPADLNTLQKRGEEGMPKTYQIKFCDGHEGCACEDELLVGPEFFDPGLEPPSQIEIATARAAAH